MDQITGTLVPKSKKKKLAGFAEKCNEFQNPTKALIERRILKQKRMYRSNLRKMPRVSYYEPMGPEFDECMRVNSLCPTEVKRPDFNAAEVNATPQESNCTDIRHNLRKKPRVSYFEPEEPSFDEYMYCDECADFVYEYCAIHGPLLVVPDDKVPHKTNFPAYVPRAALTIPHIFLHLAPSIISGAGLGVFSTLTLPRGVRFGPYCGERIPQADSMYCWQIYDRNNKRSHVVDAANGELSNWMRYVNCARHWKEQNLLAYQYQGQLYYRTIKIIPRFTELMVFYGSEFANILRIDLSKYNKKKYYEEVLSASKVFEDKMKLSTTYHTSEAINDNVNNQDDKDEECVNADQFVFIDQEQDEKENSQNDIIGLTVERNNIENDVSANLDDSSMQVECNEDNIIINFNSNDTEENRFKCKICHKKFAKTSYLNRHLKLHIRGNKLYNCQFCNFQTDSIKFFDIHVEYHTKTFKYSCKICVYKTNMKRNFNRHCLQHENNLKGIIYKCDFCPYKTNAKWNLARHVSKIH